MPNGSDTHIDLKHQLLDDAAAYEIQSRCSSHDKEANGSNLDIITILLLRNLGMDKTADAFERVDCWRA